MLPYLISFFFSILILSIIQNWSSRSIGFKFWLFIAIIIPCLLAGLRADSIGTDVAGYAEPLFDLARSSSSFSDFYSSGWHRIWRYQSVSDFEIGYVVLVWISSRLFDSLQGLLFLSQLLTIVPIVWVLMKRENRSTLALGMLVYLLLYFNMSLNIMRQWIAMAFVFMGVIGLYSPGKKFRENSVCIIPVVLGFLFHNSALLGFMTLAIRLYLDSKRGQLYRKIITVCAIAFLLLFSIGAVSSVLSSIGFGHYVNYLGRYTIELMPNQIILRLPMLAFALWAFGRANRSDSSTAFVLCVLLIAILLSQLTSLGEQSGRIGLYFDIFSIVLPSLLFKTFGRHDFGKLPTGTALISYCVIYWAFFYVISGSGETVPYLPFWN